MVKARYLAVVVAGFLFATSLRGEEEKKKLRRVICSTFTVHLLVANICQGLKDIEVERLLPPTLGCPHDYALTPAEMKKIAAADA
ncbi:MAG: hypothetical protein N3A66_03695, partial [Planctomycetota bacterium]|nr:hypothetical protein [Planctomycetota bacterium]